MACEIYNRAAKKEYQEYLRQKKSRRKTLPKHKFLTLGDDTLSARWRDFLAVLCLRDRYDCSSEVEVEENLEEDLEEDLLSHEIQRILVEDEEDSNSEDDDYDTPEISFGKNRLCGRR